MMPKCIQSIKKERKVYEADHQKALIAWANANAKEYPDLAYLNGSLNGIRKNAIQGAIAKAQGMKAGFPDLNLPAAVAPFHGLYIELKREGGKPSTEQLRWGKYLEDQGYIWACITGAIDSAKFICNYLKIKKDIISNFDWRHYGIES